MTGTGGGAGAGPLGLVVVDDQAMVREGFAALLDAQPDLVVLGTAADGRAGVDLVQRLAERGTRPDVVLMDVRMPRLDGIAATKELLSGGRFPGLRVLVLTTFDLDDHVHAALRAGASGFLLKHSPASELLRAVRVVGAGDTLLDPDVTRRLVEHFVATHPAAVEDALRPARLAALTPRETEVLGLLARGWSNAEIAGHAHLAEQTVKSHVSRIFTKLDLRDRAQAVVFAYECGLVAPGRPTGDQPPAR